MVVLSCFDGMSCGQIALERAGIKVDKYYASEIDKHAIKVTQANYPNTIQLGSITEWKNWNIEKPDLIIGGSPCQGFSFAGKQLNFNDERSKLFFTFAEIIKHYKPKYFLLENVKMKKECQDVISNILGVDPIEINSALVSAQNRKRLYWTNIPNIKQPEDKGIYLKDIIDISDKEYRPVFFTPKQKQSIIETSSYYKYDKSGKGYSSQQDRAYKLNGKINTLSASRSITKANIMFNDGFIRAMTPEEIEQCQTVPIGYTGKSGLSDNKRDDIIGNGWTVDVIAHIFRGINSAECIKLQCYSEV